MSKENQSRIPMRGLGSRIPMPGSSSSTTQSKSTTTANIKKPNQLALKVTRPTDIGPLSNLVRPNGMSQKISQFTKSSLTNLTSRILPRSYSTDKLPPKETTSQSSETPAQKSNQIPNNLTQSVPSNSKLEPEDDQMLIDETIDLVGSEENVSRFTGADGKVMLSRENLAFNPPNATFDLCRRDGTFIKSPTMMFSSPNIIGSVNCLMEPKQTSPTKIACTGSRRAVSKSRDSLNQIIGNPTRVLRLRKSGDLLGSSMSLPKSPEWGSEDALNFTMNRTAVFNSTMLNNRLVEVTPFRPALNFSLSTTNGNSQINATKMLCLTPEDSKTIIAEPSAMEVDEQCDDPQSEGATASGVVMRNETPKDDLNPQKRFSFGLDITDCTLDCSFELIDASISSTAQNAKSPIGKQGSYDIDESLGILTPDQMKEFLDSTATNHTNNLELPLISGHKMSQQFRMDQTPSPEELPLDPVSVQTDMVDEIMQTSQNMPAPSTSSHQEVSQNESDPKTEMTKSATSKVSNSIITSITSITSLDTGYIGDGELSRPASRGADQSPSKAPRNIPVHPLNWNPAPPAVHRRNDPMTDSDFFTESDADDVYQQRENQRRAQVIDGQLYGPMLQGANVFIQQQPQAETDSCMESSGVFTDVENRGDDYLLNRLAENRENLPNANDMSPDISSDTISSSHTACSQKKLNTATSSPTQHISEHQHDFIIETSSSIGSAMNECVGPVNVISDASLGSTKSAAGCEGKNEEKASGSSSVITKKATSVKKLIATNRKSHKNEANLGLKKHELSSRIGGKTRMTSKENSASGSSKKCLNGKWESVMNKIAENKCAKKKFDNVKSKVTCGVIKRNSPAKTPPSDDHSVRSIESTGAIAKQINPNGPTTNKRGRTFSKDSQQSSQSDLSLTGASPKVSRNVIARSAKKRDVRTINSSPCDLGPPSKTSTSNGTIGTPRSNTRTISITTIQKRASPQQNATAPISNISELKGSPPAKKTVPRRLPTSVVPPQEKSPLKEQNRLVGQASVQNGSPRSSIRSTHSSKPATPPPNSNSNRNGTIILDSLSVSSKVKVKELENNNSSRIANKNNSNASKTQMQMLQQLVDQQTLDKQKQMAELLHANKGVEALGVLVQYLVFNLDAFSCHTLKKEHQKTTKQLIETCHILDELKLNFHSLEQKLNEREGFFNRRECELQELHRCEIAKVKKTLDDLDNEKREKIESLEQELARKQEEASEKLRVLMKEAEIKIAARDTEVQESKIRENDLLKRIQSLTLTEDELREKVHTSEIEFSEKLHLANIRERDLTEKINQLTKQLDEFKLKADNEKRELEEKLNLSQDELLVTRQSRNTSVNESFLNRTINLNQSQLLQDEVESLRCVLELKQSEISELRKNNGELQRAADDSLAAQTKCSALESRIEDLQVQLGAKHEEEKDLLQRLKQLQDLHDNVTKKSNRLSLHNEELQWRLKQNAERYSHTISELSKSYHESSFSCNRSNEFDISGGKSNCSITECDDNDGISPPASPVIKGVVEKSDSVSWVLEMDDETPEVLANRMVRRAGSFRSDKCSPSPVPKRQKCQNNTSIQQSASATSILRQQSEPSPVKTSSSTRLRSKSVSANKVEQPKKIPRSTSNHGTKNLDIVGWKGFTSSSPSKPEVKVETMRDDLIIDEDLAKNDFFLDDGAALIGEDVPFGRSRSSTFETYDTFHRDKAPEFKKSRENRGLITCDTAVLATSELKKMRKPKLGGGEAMISGSNSEDEEEISGSTSSTVSTGPSSPSISSSGSSNQQPIGSIEDALLRWKATTPMEVSWCDDGEPSESVV